MKFAGRAKILIVTDLDANYTRVVALVSGELNLKANVPKENGKETRNNYASI